MAPQPLPEAHRLAERLAHIGAADTIDEFALRQVEADAEKLMRSDAAAANAVLVMVAALRWDVDEMKRRHRSAIRLGDSPYTRYDYSNALTVVGEIDAAFDVARDGLSRAPDDLEVLYRVIVAAVLAARFHEARALCDRWRKLSPQEEMPHEPTIASLVQAIKRGVFSEAGARKALRMASAVRRNARMRIKGFSIEPSVEDPGEFAFEYALIASPAETAELNYALACRMADSEDLLEDPGTRFVPMFVARASGGDHA